MQSVSFLIADALYCNIVHCTSTYLTSLAFAQCYSHCRNTFSAAINFRVSKMTSRLIRIKKLIIEFLGL